MPPTENEVSSGGDILTTVCGEHLVYGSVDYEGDRPAGVQIPGVGRHLLEIVVRGWLVGPRLVPHYRSQLSEGIGRLFISLIWIPDDPA